MKYQFKIFFLFLCFHASSQVEYHKLDSLENALRSETRDTARVNAMNAVSWILLHKGEFQKASKFATTAVVAASVSLQGSAEDLRTSTRLREEQAVALCNLGLIHDMQGNYPEALKYFEKALRIYSALRSNKGIAVTLNYTGNSYLGLEDFDKAIAHFKFGLKFADTRNQRLLSGFVDNIAVAYNRKGDYEQARKFLLRAISLDEAAKDSIGLAIELCNMAGNFSSMKEYSQAEKYFERALEVCKMTGNKNQEAFILNSAAMSLEEQGRSDEALKMYKEALQLSEELGFRNEMMEALLHRGKILMNSGDIDAAEADLLGGLNLAGENSYWAGMIDAQKYLSELYSAKKDWTRAIKYLKGWASVKDSVFNRDFTKSSVRSLMNLEFEKKQNVLRMERDKKEALDAAKSMRQKMTISFFGIFMICSGVFGIYAFRSYRQKERLNRQISREKHKVEEKQKEILDSINYAKRIQMALMPSDRMIRQKMNR